MLGKIEKLFSVSWFKTIYFNFKYFERQIAMKLPVVIGKKVTFSSLKGRVSIHSPVHSGMIFIQKTSLNINGDWIVKGKVRLKGGENSFIFIGKNGVLETGNEFFTNGPVGINCTKNLTFGSNCLLAHNIEILDSDFHSIYNLDGELINPDKPIIIGNRVWIGSNTLVLKGTKIGSDIIIGAGSILNNEYLQDNSIYAGVPAKLIKSGVTWDY